MFARTQFVACLLIFAAAIPGGAAPAAEDDPARPFNLWATSDAHVHTDLVFGYESLTNAIRQSEFGDETGAPGFDWDVMLHLGDLVGDANEGQGFPTDAHGLEVVRQFLTAKKHRREQIYNIIGNHDANGPHEEVQWWFRKWIDPEGNNINTSRVHKERRPYPIHGNWDRYWFQVGNILFLMMSDRNDGPPPAGRGSERGYPAGRVSVETFEWWVGMVENNRDKIIISCHHHMLKDTTVASGSGEGVAGRYHGRMPDGAPDGASYLYFVGDEPDAQKFEKYLAANPGAIDLWMGGHTHTNPDDTFGGKSHVEKKWGSWFINVAALARHHGYARTTPMSRLLQFRPGESDVRVQCYLHTSDYAQIGFYAPAERTITLRHPFSWESSAVIEPGKKTPATE